MSIKRFLKENVSSKQKVIAEYGDILYFIFRNYKLKEGYNRKQLIIDTKKVIIDTEIQQYIKLINKVIGKEVGTECRYKDYEYKLIYVDKKNRKNRVGV